ncbi:hypothetical protein U0070_011139 [Myodes glareolus]|uniref:Myelin basic protein n=1 Tax=Myodes glareolus TaxID=447135 RepID=A0AAW0IAV2_MYOGA
MNIRDSHTRTTHYGSLPQKSQHGRTQDENPVVHFFKNIVTPRTPPPSQGKDFAPGDHHYIVTVSFVTVSFSSPQGRGLSLSRFSWALVAATSGRLSSGLFLQGAEGQKPGFGYGGRASDYKSAHKGFKGAYDAQGTLSKIFKLVM